ncbi:hypothetical protein ACFV90_07275 [Streptomyces sp. NPDC059904]|uniref:hypothetical protein n=1 Tax=unclassified Streptomyces TaxID=2593676 RepID=UPI00365DCC40
MNKSTKELTIGAVVICVLAGGGLFGYQQIFTKGLDRLPAKVCDGAIKRETAARVLPDARSANDNAGVTGTGENFFLGCKVDTSGNSIVSGEAKLEDASLKNWVDYYKGKIDAKVLRVSAGDIEALSLSGTASVYVPCIPRGVNASDANQSYAMIVEARVIGKSRVKGKVLRQALTDFAYQLTEHAYKVAECQKPLKFPQDSPRYRSS